MNPTAEAVASVLTERSRQRELLKAGKIRWDLADPDSDPDDVYRLAVLTEEIGEVARALMENGPHSPELREEVCQVCAVALAWCESQEAYRPTLVKNSPENRSCGLSGATERHVT